MKKIIWTTPEGTLAVFTPSYNDELRPPDESDGDYALRKAPLVCPTGLTWRMIDDTEHPGMEDKVFRRAWVDDSVAITVDMPRARDIHLFYIRKARKNRLEELDKEIVTLEDVGRSEMDGIWEQKVSDKRELRQTLRDIPETVDLEQFTTSAELKGFWPAELARLDGEGEPYAPR